MKVLNIITSLSIGGAQMMLYKLITKMDQNKFKMRVISLTDIGPIGKRIQALGIPVETLGMKKSIADLTKIFKLVNFLKKNRPDIIQSWMYHADFVGGLAAKISGGASVAWGIRHSNLSPEGNKKTTQWTAKVCAMLSSILPSKIVCCSHASKEVHHQLGYDQNRMVVIPNGFDTEIFIPSNQARKKVRDQFGLIDDTILKGLFARFCQQKDHKNFFQAASIIHKDYPEVNFLLCGDGITWDNSIIRKWIEEAGVKSVTHLLGSWDDMPSLHASLDIAASTSSYGEGFPNVIGEAMACCVPCVVTDVGDSARIVGNTGYVVPPGNSEALANALKRMIALGGARNELGKLARIRIIENYKLEKIVKQYENLYEEMMQDK